MTSITVHDKECWICGKADGKMTVHHSIPQHLKPVKNAMVPVCRKCHDKIHYDDVAGMYSYLFKIEKLFNEGTRGIKIMTGMLNNNKKTKEKIEKLKKGQKVNLRE